MITVPKVANAANCSRVSKKKAKIGLKKKRKAAKKIYKLPSRAFSRRDKKRGTGREYDRRTPLIVRRRATGERRTKGELIRQIYWPVGIGECEERTRFENPCQTFDTENSRHREPTESHRAASWHSWFMIITGRCQLFEECVHRCRSADPPNAWHRPPVRPALMIRGIVPASEKKPPRGPRCLLSFPLNRTRPRSTSTFSFLSLTIY